MAEYIGRETFLKDIEERYCLPCKEAGKDHNGCMCRACWVDDMRGEVIDAPAADVALVVHGRWRALRKYDGRRTYRCSVCGRAIRLSLAIDINEYAPYCNCGARMDGDDDDKTD